jgi:hypothetical protein
MSEAIPLLPLYASMVWTRKTLPFNSNIQVVEVNIQNLGMETSFKSVFSPAIEFRDRVTVS